MQHAQSATSLLYPRFPSRPARTDSLAAALLQFPSGSTTTPTTSTTSVTVFPSQGLPSTRTRTYALNICVLFVCVRVCVCVSHFESLIEIINSKTNGFLLQFRSTRRETDRTSQGPRTCASFLSFFFILACRINFQALVVVAVADGLCCQGCSRLPFVFVLSCCQPFDIVFILVDCALHFA